MSKQAVIALIVVDESGEILTATRNGYGKRTRAEDYPRKGRGGLGVIDIKTSERNGEVVGATLVRDDDEIMLITDSGTLVRISVSEISTLGRNTQGVRLIRLSNEEKLVEVERIDAGDADQVEGPEGEAVAEGSAEAVDAASETENDPEADTDTNEPKPQD